jgi:hypothetical protein
VRAVQSETLAQQARPGAGGLLVSKTPIGVAHSVARQGGGFNHPFHAVLGKMGVKFVVSFLPVYGVSGNARCGLVISDAGVFEPTIKGTPISGDAEGNVPAIEPTESDAQDESWICIEAEPAEDGKLRKPVGDDAGSRVEIVHVAREPLIVAHPKFGRAPLAMVLWAKGVPAGLIPIVHFNLRYERVAAPASGGLPKHYFL